MTLAEVLIAHRDDLVAGCVARIEPKFSGFALSRDALVNALPSLVDGLTEVLAHGRSPEQLPERLAAPVKEHAELRFQQKVPSALLLQEYMALRATLLETLDRLNVSVSPRENRVLMGMLDELALFGMSRYEALQATGTADSIGTARAGQLSAEHDLEHVQQVQAALRESEEQFRLLVESVKDYGVFMISLDGKVSGWNLGAERLKGYKAEEIIGAPFATFFDTEDTQERVPERLLARARVEGSSQYEGWLVRKNRERFWSIVNIDAVRDAQGTLVGFSNVARDQTERKQAEEEQTFLSDAGQVLAGSLDFETTLREVVGFATRGWADWSTLYLQQGELLVPAACAHRDPSMEALLREWLTPLPGVGNRAIRAAFRSGASVSCSDPGESAWVRSELGLATPDALQTLGARAFVCAPLTARGQTFGVLTLVATTADRMRGPSDLRFAEELARRGALALANARLYRQASDAVHARDEFISMASHDLRTPLSTLRLQLQRLLGKTAGAEPNRSSSADLARSLEQMKGQADRMLRLMDSLLDVTRISAGHLELSAAEGDLTLVAQECIARLGEDLARAGCEVSLRGDASVTGVWDLTRIEQVVTNLLSNALKFGRGKPIEVTVEERGPIARLSVRDHGIGIAPEDQLHLFDRFERVKTASDLEGFGVGLWIVQRAVEAHGGTVRVRSAPGAGSTFIVEIPRGRVGLAPPLEELLPH
jgi:PAS domain S-box-containing protein